LQQLVADGEDCRRVGSKHDKQQADPGQFLFVGPTRGSASSTA
jgi:hypothetical protein